MTADRPSQTATIARGVLQIRDSPELSLGGSRGCPPVLLLDISGRRVLDLQPGANDVRFAPEAYFMRTAEAGDGRHRVRIRKVVLTDGSQS